MKFTKPKILAEKESLNKVLGDLGLLSLDVCIICIAD